MELKKISKRKNIVNEDLEYMLNFAEFYQVKEMLFCMDGLSCSDKKMVKIINSNGGLNKYFEQVKTRYIIFLGQNSN